MSHLSKRQLVNVFEFSSKCQESDFFLFKKKKKTLPKGFFKSGDLNQPLNVDSRRLSAALGPTACAPKVLLPKAH